MFCRNCGKYINSDADFCEECISKTNNASIPTPTYSSELAQNTNIMLGFGKALTGAILGTVGLLFNIFGFAFITVGLYDEPASMLIGALMYTSSIVMIILSIVLGIQSIKLFIAVKNAGGRKPIPALAVGIDSVITGGIAALYGLIILFILMILIASIA